MAVTATVTLAHKLGQLQPFFSCIPAEMHGPTGIVRAKLTHLCSPQGMTVTVTAVGDDEVTIDANHQVHRGLY
jgi:hypothetical protein